MTTLPPRHRSILRALATVLAIALVTSVVRAGSHYFYCPFTHTIAASHCCATDPPREAPAFDVPDCCESMTLGTPPLARTTSATLDVHLAAPLVAALVPIVRDVSAHEPPRFTVARSGLSPPPAKRSSQKIVLRM